jgi:hypothetical protein
VTQSIAATLCSRSKIVAREAEKMLQDIDQAEGLAAELDKGQEKAARVAEEQKKKHLGEKERVKESNQRREKARARKRDEKRDKQDCPLEPRMTSELEFSQEIRFHVHLPSTNTMLFICLSIKETIKELSLSCPDHVHICKA